MYSFCDTRFRFFNDFAPRLLIFFNTLTTQRIIQCFFLISHCPLLFFNPNDRARFLIDFRRNLRDFTRFF
ncbi:hypothetical protein THIOM_002371 [Candidatus Thiomargarita nelsonii]|uniref:Uncharacterized protein n=1 Tax=Candidatus Thiomargarita nelsonii TaxID=1003181 RepID=A0A176S195_9GAMM|nr:hypothetical protein THIOM_002371 [Candidatus Thiomargarita nelsonii]